jgi:hypothetical protein
MSPTMHRSNGNHQSCREERSGVLSAADVIFVNVIIKDKQISCSRGLQRNVLIFVRRDCERPRNSKFQPVTGQRFKTSLEIPRYLIDNFITIYSIKILLIAASVGNLFTT